jgi:hypothetical protein
VRGECDLYDTDTCICFSTCDVMLKIERRLCVGIEDGRWLQGMGIHRCRFKVVEIRRRCGL